MGIADRSIAFAFDLRCGELLLEFESEQEEIRLQKSMAGNALAGMLGGGNASVGVDGSGPTVLDA